MAVALVGGAASCRTDEPTASRAARRPAEPQRVRSRDGVLAVTLPPGLLVHRFRDAIQGTAADGAFRVHVQHRPPEAILPLAGGAKETLRARGWRITAEQHLEQAIEVRLEHGGGPAGPLEVRTLWVIGRATGSVICDGIASEGERARVESLRELCQTAALTVVAPAAEAADAGSASGE